MIGKCKIKSFRIFTKLTVLISVAVLLRCTPDKVEYFGTDYQKAFMVAHHEDKMIFIDFYTVWCGPCKLFDQTIKSDSIFKEFMIENFITLQIDAEHENNNEIVTKYHPNGYPTFLIIDSEGKEIDRIGGLTEHSPQEFIEHINNVLMGKEELEVLKSLYYQKPDSLELFTKIVFDKLLEKQLYNSVTNFSNHSVSISNNPSIIEMAEYSKAYASVRNPQHRSAGPMVDFVNQTNNLRLKENGYRELFNYYRSSNHRDSTKMCLETLITFESGNHLAYVRDYAKFLYRNNIELELADRLRIEYSEYPGNQADHWTPYLFAHQLAKQGQLNKGIRFFDDWMEKYTKSDNINDDYWHYKYYIQLILDYKVASKRAIQFAELLELQNPNIENKQQLAELYYLNGQSKEAAEKVHEMIKITEDPNKINDYNSLLQQYKVGSGI